MLTSLNDYCIIKSYLRLQDNFDLDFLMYTKKVFLHRDQTDLNHCQDDKENSWTCHIILELGIRLLPIVQLCVESSKGPFIYYVSTWRGGGGQKIIHIAYFQNIKYAYIGGEGVKKAPNCAYVIYEWYLKQRKVGSNSPSIEQHFLEWKIQCGNGNSFSSEDTKPSLKIG